ncbi:MAG: CRTAC1 family protein, partial [Planctomycetia bacterium]
RLYHNNGDGTDSDVTAEAGVGRGDKVGAGAAFLDADGDGDLDLYVANYVRFTLDNHVVIQEDGHPRYAGPRSYEPETHDFFRNEGDGRFVDSSVASGIAAHPGSGMGVVAADFDDDGDADLFVLNDVLRNFLLENDGHGVFEEVGIAAGVAYNGAGDELGSMGVVCGDYDNDGRLDCLVTSYQGELPVLFRGLGGGVFEDATTRARAGEGTVAHVKWGVGLVDFDTDGHRDIFYACGHLQDTIELSDRSTAWRVRNVLLRNDGSGVFRDVSAAAGSGLAVVASSRGAAFDDLDDDGRVDAVILISRERPTILRNASPGGHWLQIRLVGTSANRDAVGASVIVEAGGLRQRADVHSGRGYQGHFGTRLSFGLGAADHADRIMVRWPGGGVTRVEGVAADRLLTLVEPAALRAREDDHGT